jgi:hypothetical protein
LLAKPLPHLPRGSDTLSGQFGFYGVPIVRWLDPHKLTIEVGLLSPVPSEPETSWLAVASQPQAFVSAFGKAQKLGFAPGFP